jgi:tRNA G26 N,N-dimethylase Trm1
MERRSFVKLSAFTALALTLPFAESCSTGSKEMAVAQPLLFSHLVDAKAIREAGLAYRKTRTVEDDQQKLSQLLLSEKETASLNKNEIESMLDKQVTNDFEAGNTVMVKGWVMSLTEARQCALFSILKS